MEIPDRAGVMVLSGACLFPQALLPLFIFEPRYRQMLAASLDGHRMFVIAMARPGSTRETPLPVAGLGLVRASVENDDGTSNLVVQGLSRVRLGKVIRYKPFRIMQIEPMVTDTAPSLLLTALEARVLDLVEARLQQGAVTSLSLLAQAAAGVTPPMEGDINDKISVESCLKSLRFLDNPSLLADLVALMLLSNPLARQIILQTVVVEERLKQLVRFLLAEVAHGRKEGSEG